MVKQFLIQFITTPREGSANCWNPYIISQYTINTLGIHLGITNDQCTLVPRKSPISINIGAGNLRNHIMELMNIQESIF
jgi:hypothetical protein